MKKTPRLPRACAVLLLAGAVLPALATPAPKDLDRQLRWVKADVGGGKVTLDPASRLLLARSAAERARLHEVGLDFRDVYGVIHAETSWVPRAGMGKNGVVSQGLGQFEPATARAVGLRDPNDAVQAVHAAARLLREAAQWSSRRIAGLGLSPQQRAAKLREGVSIYYNLSSRARSTWTGLNSHRLPVETQRHIRNVRLGAQQADRLYTRLAGARLPPLPAAPQVQLASVQQAEQATHTPAKKPAAPRPVGTIEWSGDGGKGGPNAGRRTYVVWSNGDIRPQGAGEVPKDAIRFTQRGKT